MGDRSGFPDADGNECLGAIVLARGKMGISGPFTIKLINIWGIVSSS
jgi:hypothetical protein